MWKSFIRVYDKTLQKEQNIEFAVWTIDKLS